MSEYLKEVISEEMIFLNKKFKNQNEVISFIVENASVNGYITDKKIFFESVKKREEEIPTAIGYSIAMPHGKSEVVEYPFIAFVRTSNEIKWSEKSDEKVQLIFLIGVPEKSKGKLHLKFISQLSKKLLDDKFRENLFSTESSEEVLKELKLIEL